MPSCLLNSSVQTGGGTMAKSSAGGMLAEIPESQATGALARLIDARKIDAIL